jgi:hypothetical protein
MQRRQFHEENLNPDNHFGYLRADDLTGFGPNTVPDAGSTD